ncbi:MAG: choice-of-anchor J domain-containing protein, partial [Bacteroidales bacterium]|nr:choice-of-anchor J domain-containing protein [Bacteroidales bacterium]
MKRLLTFLVLMLAIISIQGQMVKSVSEAMPKATVETMNVSVQDASTGMIAHDAAKVAEKLITDKKQRGVTQDSRLKTLDKFAFSTNTTEPAKSRATSELTIYEEGFEATVDSILPTGWTRTGTTRAQGWHAHLGTNTTFPPPGFNSPFSFPARTGTRYMIATWSAPASWAWSAGINLVAGKTYDISFWYVAPGDPEYVEYDNFEVFIGQTADATLATTGTSILRQFGVYGPSAYTQVTKRFVPTTSGVYYLGFQKITGGQGFYIAIDDISVVEIVPATGVDVELAEIIQPNSGISLTAVEPVKVLITNNGTVTLTSVSLELKLDGHIIATETWTGSLTSIQSAEYTFAATLNLAAEGTYEVVVTATAAGDVDPTNNSLLKTVTNTVIPTINTFPWTENFASTTFPPSGMLNLSSNAVNSRWVRNTAAPLVAGTTAHARYPNTNGTAGQISLLITEPIEIPATGVLALSFFDRFQYGEDGGTFGVWVSTTDNSPASFTLFSNSPVRGSGVTWTAWQQNEVTLQDYAGQIIFIAFAVRGQASGWTSGWDVSNITIKALPTNDLRITNAFYPFTQVPVSQNMLSPLSASVLNYGTAQQTNATLSVTRNGTNVATSTPTNIAPFATVTLNAPLTTATTPVVLGANTLVYTVTQTETDENPADNVATASFIGTENVYAMDVDGTAGYIIGNANSCLGNIFTVNAPMELNQILWQT